MAVSPQEDRTQVSVVMDAKLRERLESEARRAVRSLSGEITYRLLRSLEGQSEAVVSA